MVQEGQRTRQRTLVQGIFFFFFFLSSSVLDEQLSMIPKERAWLPDRQRCSERKKKEKDLKYIGTSKWNERKLQKIEKEVKFRKAKGKKT